MDSFVKSLPAKAVSVFASVCLTLALVPAVALADNATSGEVSLSQSEVSLASGGAFSLMDIVSADGLDGDYHFDFVAAEDTTCFTVNKHSGVVIAGSSLEEAASSTVTVYLMAGEQPENDNGKPCSSCTVLSKAEVTVSVAASSGDTYGYQGSGFTIKLASPDVKSTSSSTSDGVTTYCNVLYSQIEGETVQFTYEQSAGLNQYLNYYSTWTDESGASYGSAAAAYKDLAGQYISYTGPDGETTTVAESADVTVDSVSSSEVAISVPLDDGTGVGELAFDSDLHTFNQNDTSTVNKSLGADVVFEFPIVDEKPSVEDATLTLSETSFTSTGSAIEPEVTVTSSDGVTLVEGIDYTVSYSDNVEAGTATVTVTGSGDYTGTATTTFTIVAASDDSSSDGSDDAADSGSSDSGSSSSSLVSISKATVTLSKSSVSYTGKAQKVGVKSVKLSGKTLPSSAYTVSYAGNKNIGTATVTVKGSASAGYTGSASATFSIKPAKVSVKSAKVAKKSAKVKLSKGKGGVKYQVKYRVKGSKKWKSVSSKKNAVTLKKLKSGKRYQVKARAVKKVGGKTYASAWSKVKTTKKVK